jgi:hypothetical protein
MWLLVGNRLVAANAVPRSLILSTMNMDPTGPSETSAVTKQTRHHIFKYAILCTGRKDCVNMFQFLLEYNALLVFRLGDASVLKIEALDCFVTCANLKWNKQRYHPKGYGLPLLRLRKINPLFE